MTTCKQYSIHVLWVGLSLMAMLAGTAAAERAPAAAAPTEVVLDIQIGEPVMLAGQPQKAYVKIAVTGFDLPATARRTPVNLALVLDRSGSMAGDKLEKAKEAAIMVLDRLGPEDIVSAITYDSTVEVLVPATKLRQRQAIRAAIAGIGSRGSTALFAGVSYGIEEVGKFLDGNRVSRVILLSDGQANVGPSSPNELGRLGQAAGKRGIAVTTIGLGLGYNEDLMTQLALRSDGNHGFAETADQLAALFQHELGDVLSVVAQDVNIEVEFDVGVRPIRGLNRDIAIHGRKAVLALNQLYSTQEKYFLIEVEVPAGTAGMKRELARVSLGYDNTVTRKRHALQAGLPVAFTGSKELVARSENTQVMVAAIEAIAVERNRQAVALRDSGKIEDAEKVLLENASELQRQSRRYKSKRLEEYSDTNRTDAKNLDDKAWTKQRKSMRKHQHTLDTNQSY